MDHRLACRKSAGRAPNRIRAETTRLARLEHHEKPALKKHAALVAMTCGFISASILRPLTDSSPPFPQPAQMLLRLGHSVPDAQPASAMMVNRRDIEQREELSPTTLLNAGPIHCLDDVAPV